MLRKNIHFKKNVGKFFISHDFSQCSNALEEIIQSTLKRGFEDVLEDLHSYMLNTFISKIIMDHTKISAFNYCLFGKL